MRTMTPRQARRRAGDEDPAPTPPPPEWPLVLARVPRPDGEAGVKCWALADDHGEEHGIRRIVLRCDPTVTTLVPPADTRPFDPRAGCACPNVPADGGVFPTFCPGCGLGRVYGHRWDRTHRGGPAYACGATYEAHPREGAPREYRATCPTGFVGVALVLRSPPWGAGSKFAVEQIVDRVGGGRVIGPTAAAAMVAREAAVRWPRAQWTRVPDDSEWGFHVDGPDGSVLMFTHWRGGPAAREIVTT